jgi:AraC-like DNA-binding protein
MIKIELEDYNIDKCTIVLIKEFIKNNSKYTYVEMAEALGISERTLYRYINRFDIPIGKNRISLVDALKVLEENGYKIISK